MLPFRTRKQQALDENWKGAEKDVDDLPLFDLAVILAATDSFSASNKIGEGGFGPVYMVSKNDRKECVLVNSRMINLII